MKTNGNTWQKMGRGWLMLAAAMLLTLTGCRTATPEPWSYQWQQGSEGTAAAMYAVNQTTCDVAQWNTYTKEWAVFRTDIPPLDWDGALARRDVRIKEDEEELARQEAEREAVRAAFAQLPLAEQVAKAFAIETRTYKELTPQEASRFESSGINHEKIMMSYTGDVFKQNRHWGTSKISAEARPDIGLEERPGVKGGDVVVVFTVPVPALRRPTEALRRRMMTRRTRMLPTPVSPWAKVYLSSMAAPDNKLIFSASPTIVEDVKAEIERQKALSEAKSD